LFRFGVIKGNSLKGDPSFPGKARKLFRHGFMVHLPNGKIHSGKLLANLIQSKMLRQEPRKLAVKELKRRHQAVSCKRKKPDRWKDVGQRRARSIEEKNGRNDSAECDRFEQ